MRQRISKFLGIEEKPKSITTEEKKSSIKLKHKNHFSSAGKILLGLVTNTVQAGNVLFKKNFYGYPGEGMVDIWSRSDSEDIKWINATYLALSKHSECVKVEPFKWYDWGQTVYHDICSNISNMPRIDISCKVDYAGGSCRHPSLYACVRDIIYDVCKASVIPTPTPPSESSTDWTGVIAIGSVVTLLMATGYGFYKYKRRQSEAQCRVSEDAADNAEYFPLPHVAISIT